MGFCAVRDAMHGGGTIIGIYEPDHSLIKSVAIPRVIYWLEEFKIKYKVNYTDFKIYTEPHSVGTFIFKSMENVDALVGYETYTSHIDELDTLPMDKAEKVWQKIMGRNRLNPRDVPTEFKIWNESKEMYEANNRISAYTTPEGFKFCHKMWELNPNPDFASVKGRTEENPTLSDAYLRQLRDSYPSNLIEAYLNGEFVNLNAATVYDAYDIERCRSYEEIEPQDILYIGCDFNVNHQTAVVFVKRNGNQFHAVDELVDMRDTPDMIKIFTERYSKYPIVVYPDASGMARKTVNASASDIALLQQAGYAVRANKKNPLIKDRINALQQGFTQGRIFVNPLKCPNAVKCLQQQAYDKNGMPDKKNNTDHSNDAIGYLAAYELPIRRQLFNLPIKFVT